MQTSGQGHANARWLEFRSLREMMEMVRLRMVAWVRYGHFREFSEIAEEMNAVARVRGWQESTHWCPTVGPANQFIIETEYPSLDAFEREHHAMNDDPEFMKLVRRSIEHVVEGALRDELIEPAAHIA